MAKILNTHNILGGISTIISDAKQYIILISPYIRISSSLHEKLCNAGLRNTQIIVVCREEDLKDDQRELLLSTPGLELYTHSNVHTKCYYNEHQMVMGSMNLYSYSSDNNRELGIMFELEQDKKLYDDAERECYEIIQMAQQTGKHYNTKYSGAKNHTNRYGASSAHTSDKQNAQSASAKSKENTSQRQNFTYQRPDNRNFLEKLADTFSHQGYCLRCKAKLQYNPHAPYCPSCYGSWVQWGNRDFTEKYCHSCGEFTATTMNRPLCKYCYANGR